MWKMMYMLRSLACRAASIHYCCDNSDAKSMMSLATRSLDPKSLSRFRSHRGTIEHVVKELSTFGIGSKLISGSTDPRSEESAILIREWVAHRHSREEEQVKRAGSSHALVFNSDIGNYDVLFGRGKGVQCHPGNQRLRHLVEANSNRYEEASRLDKTLIAERILRNVKDASGRFLKFGGYVGRMGWIKVDDDTARGKIAHSFRTHRRSVLRGSSASVLNMKDPPPGGDNTSFGLRKKL
mmetsp:Transcript_7442/g.17440  ORF Transcript_7442/g.17440 Transcript_7442/m.17440 type:complete len:239 (-) Transcript_7442:389-1105(-)